MNIIERAIIESDEEIQELLKDIQKLHRKMMFQRLITGIGICLLMIMCLTM